jgi:hypothetical protein
MLVFTTLITWFGPAAPNGSAGMNTAPVLFKASTKSFDSNEATWPLPSGAIGAGVGGV